jgi:hypothetical protein
MARCLELNGSLARCLRAASFQPMGKKKPYAIARNKLKSTVIFAMDSYNQE